MWILPRGAHDDDDDDDDDDYGDNYEDDYEDDYEDVDDDDDVSFAKTCAWAVSCECRPDLNRQPTPYNLTIIIVGWPYYDDDFDDDDGDYDDDIAWPEKSNTLGPKNCRGSQRLAFLL